MNSAEVMKRAGCTYRQLDYWSRMGYLDGAQPGSGNARDWTGAQADEAATLARLVASGFTVAAAVDIKAHDSSAPIPLAAGWLFLRPMKR